MKWGTQNSEQFKTCELFIAGILYLIFSNCSWPWVTETVESKTADKRVGNYCSFCIWRRKCWFWLSDIYLLSKSIRHLLCADTALGARIQRELIYNCCLSRTESWVKIIFRLSRVHSPVKKTSIIQINITNISGAMAAVQYIIGPLRVWELWERLFENSWDVLQNEWKLSKWLSCGEVAQETILNNHAMSHGVRNNEAKEETGFTSGKSP